MTCPHPEKRRYRSKAEAREVIAAMYRTGNGNPDLNAYGCVCGAIHIGHSGRRLTQRIRVAVSAGTRNSRRARRKR